MEATTKWLDRLRQAKPGNLRIVFLAVSLFPAPLALSLDTVPSYTPEQLRENAAKDFYNRLGELVKEQFFGKPEIKGILVGGPGPTKYTFIEGNFIPTEVKQKIIAVRDLSYTGEFGLEELLDKSQDALANEEVGREKALMNRFFKFLATQMGMVSYGKDAVMRLLKLGAVETLLLSEALDDATLEEFEEEAKKMGTTVELISTETREGVQLRDLGKIGAILRYETR